MTLREAPPRSLCGTRQAGDQTSRLEGACETGDRPFCLRACVSRSRIGGPESALPRVLIRGGETGGVHGDVDQFNRAVRRELGLARVDGDDGAVADEEPV